MIVGQAQWENDVPGVVSSANVIVSCGPAGVRTLDAKVWQSEGGLRVLVDANAVEPSGIEGVGVNDNAEKIGEVTAFGALAVGELKMKCHRMMIEKLFSKSDGFYSLPEFLEVCRKLV